MLIRPNNEVDSRTGCAQGCARLCGVMKLRGCHQGSNVIRVEVTKLSGDGTVPGGGGALILYAGP